MHRHLLACSLLTAVACLVVSSCGQTRRYGDDQGAPVAFTVSLDRAFVKAMHNNQWRPSVGAGASFSSGGSRSYGTGVGVSFSSTNVYLLGGEGPAEAQVFRRELKWGDNAFTVPLTPGRTLHLTVKAEGGREGWESLGEFPVPRDGDPRFSITLGRDGAKVTVTPAPAPVPPALESSKPTTDAGPAVERAAPAAPTPAEPSTPATDASANSESSTSPAAPAIDPAATLPADPGQGNRSQDTRTPNLQLEPPPPATSPAAPYPDPALDH